MMQRIEQPPHPGRLVRDRCLSAHGLGVADGARLLGVSRQALSNLVTGRAGLSADMAVRLSKAFGGSDEEWMRLQLAYELAGARRRAHGLRVMPFNRTAREDIARTTQCRSNVTVLPE